MSTSTLVFSLLSLPMSCCRQGQLIFPCFRHLWGKEWLFLINRIGLGPSGLDSPLSLLSSLSMSCSFSLFLSLSLPPWWDEFLWVSGGPKERGGSGGWRRRLWQRRPRRWMGLSLPQIRGSGRQPHQLSLSHIFLSTVSLPTDTTHTNTAGSLALSHTHTHTHILTHTHWYTHSHVHRHMHIYKHTHNTAVFIGTYCMRLSLNLYMSWQVWAEDSICLRACVCTCVRARVCVYQFLFTHMWLFSLVLRLSNSGLITVADMRVARGQLNGY